MGRGPKPARSREAKPPIARRLPKDEDSTVRDLEERLAGVQGQLSARDRELTEALDQQTATSEILKVISSSPTDIQPIFDAIVRSASRLCGGEYAIVTQYDGQLLHLAAQYNARPGTADETAKHFPQAPNRGGVTPRAFLDARMVHVPDVDAEELAPSTREFYGRIGLRAVLAVPMIQEGRPIGVVSISRGSRGPFSDRQIALLQTFADQAVIAIENVRLFTELQARNRDLTTALDTQTATADILRVISSSPTDVQPVFDAVAESAARLCDAIDVTIFRRDGDLLRLVAHCGELPVGAIGEFSLALRRETVGGRCVLEGRTLHLADVQTETDEFPEAVGHARRFGHRAMLSVPLMRNDVAIGVIQLRRTEAERFTDRQVALLKTFADQAVIAIENVRLFTELQASNRELTTALDQQTATSEILRVISRSQTDVQPVFDTIVQSAVRLCAGLFGALFQFDGELLHMVAHHNYTPEALEAAHGVYPARPSRDHGSVRAIVERAVVHIPDVELDPEHQHRELRRAIGQRSGLFVPMLRGGDPIGVIMVARPEPGPFSNNEIELLQTFADQAVIAIENVRLFKELQEKNRALTTAHAQVTESLEQQTATAEILRVIAASPTDIQSVLDSVAESAGRLCEASDTQVYRLDADELRLVAHYGAIPTGPVGEFTVPVIPGVVSGRTVLERRIVHLADLQLEENEFPVGSQLARRFGYRASLSVPLMREGRPLGAIHLRRTEARLFTERQIALLQTFADQAAIAIENVRLFTDLQTRTEELSRSVDKLTALGEVGRAVSSTLDLDTVLSTIVSRAIQLSGTDGGSVYEYHEATEEFSLRASRDLPEAYVEQVRGTRPRKGEGAVGRVAQTREPIQIADIADAAAYESRVRSILLQMGLRALLAVPLIAEDQLVGALIVMRRRSGRFAAEEVALLQTFATQSALAIQNARLFREIEEKSRQLEVASQHKSEFLANMSHELRTPLNAIIGFSEVLSDRMFGELNEKQEEYLKDIYASGTHLLSLINDILDLSKIEAGRMELELSDFHLPAALENALMLVRERAGRRSIALHTSIDNRLGEIQGDERKIRQVVLNLLSNAIKFTPEGGRIELAAVSKDSCVEVSVSDTGIGIAPEDQERVFEEFRQVGTADKKAEGTGLGLTLCRKFIELHAGRIWVKSALGVGSTFTFTIPLRLGQ